MKIGSVIVTFNRIKLLAELLDLYSSLENGPDLLLIVNNCSTDGTREYLEKWLEQPSSFSKHVMNLEENTGGSGGFFEGLKFLVEKNYDWVWVCDDDAFPEKNIFTELRKIVSLSGNDVAAICTSVVDVDGKYQLHRAKIERSFPFELEVLGEHHYKSTFDCDLFTYVGVLIRAESIKKAGLPEKNYFICEDDLEHSLRIRKTGRIICYPQIKVIHKQASPCSEARWKVYYIIRNRLLMLKKHYYLSFLTKASLLYFKQVIKSFLNYKTSNCELIKDAVRDAFLDKNGKNPKYSPSSVQKRGELPVNEHRQL